jgi:hypothetical protein
MCVGMCEMCVVMCGTCVVMCGTCGMCECVVWRGEECGASSARRCKVHRKVAKGGKRKRKIAKKSENVKKRSRAKE